MSRISPYIRPIQIQGGTFYTFSSASEDLGFTFNNDGKVFKFSKYVLLNIPDIKRPSSGEMNWENCIQLDAIPGAFKHVYNTKSYNMMFAESFQNYVLNLETMVTQYPSYNVENLQNVSERVFFKWLKEIGALRFREASLTESPLETGLRFTEELDSERYNRVVKYIGEIDIINSVKNAADAYSEVYIHIPTKDGATPLILFKSLSDENYFSGQNLINIPDDPINTELIAGRTITSQNPAGLVIQAFFDSDYNSYGENLELNSVYLENTPQPSNGYQLYKWDDASSQYLANWWFPYASGNSYWTQPPAITGKFDDPRNDSFMIRGIKENNIYDEVKFQRSRLDGIMIDFDIDNYFPIASNPALKSFSDFNSLTQTQSFEFNTVLVYYDIADISTDESATNLFGVLFLDNVEDTISGGGSIPKLTKYKPNKITGLNGNSFGFKLNLKFDINSDDAAIVTSINEYAPFSMQVFVDALNQLQSASDALLNQTQLVNDLFIEVEDLKGLVYNDDDLEEIMQRIINIESRLTTAGALYENSQTILELIQRNYDEIMNIYNNKTTVSVSYNTDVLVSGEGIILDKNTPNQVSIRNIRQGYNIDKSPTVNILTEFNNSQQSWNKIFLLKQYTNYIKISNETPVIFDKDIEIFIDDSDQRWSNGQIFKIVIDHNYPIDMYSNGSFDLMVYTGSLDRLNTGQEFSKLIGRIPSNHFYKKEGIAQIEIICINSESYEFEYDII